MSDDDFLTLVISLKTAACATVLAVAFGWIAAWMMAFRRFRGKPLLEGLFLAPLVLPPTVVGFLLLLLLGKGGPLGGLAVALLGETLLFSWPAAVLAAAVVAFPLVYRTARGAFEQIDPSILAAAQTLGAGKARVFFQIGLGLAWPGIIAGVVLAFARALGEFGATLMVAGNMVGVTQTIPLAIYTDVASGEMAHAGMWVGVVAGLTLLLTVLAAPVVKHPLFWRRRRAPRRLGGPLPRQSLVPDSDHRETELQVSLTKVLPAFSLDVSFVLRRKSCAVVGASGSGKSLLLRCLAGLERPDSGIVSLSGRALFDAARNLSIPVHQRRVGYVFQNYALFNHLSVYENIAFGLGRLDEGLRQREAWRLLDATELADCATKLPAELSGGQQQRLAIARALGVNPRLALFDEPLSALDSHLRYRLEQLLVETMRGFSGKAILVTHNIDEAFRICEDLVVMDAGRVIAAGDKHEVFAQPGSVRAAVVTGCKNISRLGPGTAPGLWAALDWGCELNWHQDRSPGGATHCGIRAHHLTLRPHDGTPEANAFQCWLMSMTETAHRVTAHIKLGMAPTSETDQHLEVELSKDCWERIQAAPQPWLVTLPGLRLMDLRDDVGPGPQSGFAGIP